MAKILGEHDQQVVKRQVIAILQSPQGRDLGRWFLTERGKQDGGNLAQIKREIFDILSDSIQDLYAATPPVLSR